MKTVKRNDILEELKICPYCGYPQKGKMFCCGETHFIDAYRVGNEVLTVDEVEIENETTSLVAIGGTP